MQPLFGCELIEQGYGIPEACAFGQQIAIRSMRNVEPLWTWPTPIGNSVLENHHVSKDRHTTGAEL